MQKENFQLKTDKITASLGENRPTLLLHSCCGPCSSYVLEYLTRFFDITLLFYGPNIQPREEYELRLDHQRRVLEHIPVKIMECGYEGEEFDAIAEGYEDEPEGGARCTRCFALRIEETAKRAAEAVREHYGFEASFGPGSTDCNIPLSLGIPAICPGCVMGWGAHTREESVEIDSLLPGLKVAAQLILHHF